MYLTHHGHDRAETRTRLQPQAILRLIEQGAFVSLGTCLAKGMEFLLFYSIPDSCAKVALVSPDRKVLITVLHTRFVPPQGLKQPSLRQQRHAQRLATQVASRIPAQYGGLLQSAPVR